MHRRQRELIQGFLQKCLKSGSIRPSDSKQSDLPDAGFNNPLHKEGRACQAQDKPASFTQ
jgi:hypothetical protein